MWKYFIFLSVIFISSANADESIYYGTTSHGRLKKGVKLPTEGKNFVSYSKIAELLGRTYVHSKVKEIIVAAYKWLETEEPNKVYKYAESGFEEGGRFSLHRTHQNGLSVDFMVPVINKEGKSVYFSTNIFNKFGYSIEFDDVGKYEGYRIDYDALAAHIVALHKAAINKGG